MIYVQMCPSSSPAGGGAARQALFGSDYMYCVTRECPQLIDQHLLCDPKQQFAMASAEEKWKDELKDQQESARLKTSKEESTKGRKKKRERREKKEPSAPRNEGACHKRQPLHQSLKRI